VQPADLEGEQLMTQLPPLDELGPPVEQPVDVTPEEEHAARPMEAGSLQERLHQRRAEMQAQEPEEFDVPGYEGIIVARYQILPWKQHRAITARHEKSRDVAERDMYVAADTLINACVDLAEVLPDGSRKPLGYKWGVKAAQELFGVDSPLETARQGILACFPRDGLLMSHYGEVMQWQQGAQPKVDRELEQELGKADSPN
jgi:hypothetical protein